MEPGEVLFARHIETRLREAVEVLIPDEDRPPGSRWGSLTDGEVIVRARERLQSVLADIEATLSQR